MASKCYFVFILCLIITCCSKPPIKIGYSGTLTGKYAETGIDGKQACVLAVEEINEAGGIRGRLLELVISDDRNDPESAVKGDTELIEAGVTAIIGHITSNMSKAALPLVNKHKVVMISPTSSSSFFTGKDDYFFRVKSPSDNECKQLAVYTTEILGLQKFIMIYDGTNEAYSGQWYRDFKRYYEELGGLVYEPVIFYSDNNFSYSEVINDALTRYPDAQGVAIAADAHDTALLCQQLYKTGVTLPVIAAGWAKTDKVIQYGGKAVEGVMFADIFNWDSSNTYYLMFKDKFKQRFGREPDIVNTLSYEAMQLLIQALTIQKKNETVKEALLRIASFPGLQDDIILDRYGDADRHGFIIVLKEGRFTIIDK